MLVSNIGSKTSHLCVCVSRDSFQESPTILRPCSSGVSVQVKFEILIFTDDFCNHSLHEFSDTRNVCLIKVCSDHASSQC